VEAPATAGREPRWALALLAALMPAFHHLDNRQIAATATYIHQEFGNRPVTVEPAIVAAIRGATAGRQVPWSDEELKRVPPSD
jgi:mono/diheme cytochrome c family protein